MSEGDRAVHYENLYFLAKQLHDDLLDEYDNPAIRSFVESAVEQVLPQSSSLPGNAYDELRKGAEGVLKHIRGNIVSLISSHQPTRLDHLDFVVEAIQEGGSCVPALLTLNHDTLLETVLGARSLDFTDGFAKEPNPIGVREWQPGQLLGHADTIRLLKLHGGIDWYRFGPAGAKAWLQEYVGIQTPAYSEYRRDTLGRMHERLDDSLPIFMIGSWDKLSRDTDPVYLEVYYGSSSIVMSL